MIYISKPSSLSLRRILLIAANCFGEASLPPSKNFGKTDNSEISFS